MYLHMKLKMMVLLLSSAADQCLLRDLAVRCFLCRRHPLCYCSIQPSLHTVMWFHPLILLTSLKAACTA